MIKPEWDKSYVTIYFMQAAKESRRVAIRRITLILGGLAVVFLVLGAKVWLQMQTVKLGYEINLQRKTVQQLWDEHRMLMSRRNALASLDRIESLARQELGLSTPDQTQLIFLQDPAERAQQAPGWLKWLRNPFVREEDPLRQTSLRPLDK